MDYLDFELEIDAGTGYEYPVRVINSPAGEARATMCFPFGELELESRLKDLQIALLRSGGQRRQSLLPEQETVQDFGRALFDALLTGDVRGCYDVSLRDATLQGCGLRLKLRINTPEMAALPWEFLYDPRRAEYVCLSYDTPILRYLELPQPIQPLTVAPPLRILGMVASPSDLDPLNVDLEKQRVEMALRGLQDVGLVELTWLEGQTWRALQRAMRRGEWHIFHFIGHGGFDATMDEGLVMLCGEDGAAQRMSATQLGRLLANHRALRLVLLNACEGATGGTRDLFSSTASILVRRGLPAVLAMQYPITDYAAIEFSRAFYESLVDGLSVDAAVVESRVAISMAINNSVEWGAPVLFMRSPDGVLFRIQGAGSEIKSRKEQAKSKPPVQPVTQPVAGNSQLVTAGQPLEPEKILIPAADLRLGLTQVTFAASIDEKNYPILTGVLAEFEDKMLTLGAADGFRLSMRQIPLIHPVPTASRFIIPVRTLSALQRILGSQEEPVSISTTRPDTILFQLSDTVLNSQLLDGNFPDLRRIIPTSYSTRVVLDREEILRTCHSAATFTSGATNIVTMSIEPGRVVVSDLSGQLSTRLQANVEGKGVEIAFNVAYLVDVFSALDTSQVALELNSPGDPSVVKAIGDNAFIHVLMPMHLGS